MRRLGCIIVFLGAAFLRAAPLYAQGAVTGFVGGTPPDGRIMSGVLTSTGLTGTLQLDATNRLPVSTFPGAGGLQAVNLTQVLSAAHAATNPVHVRLTSGAASVDPSALAVVGGGAEATAIRFTLANDSTGLLSVDDNGGSLTVDNAALSVTGGGAELGALRVTVANDSTGVLSVDDGGGALTIDSGQLPAALVGGRLDVNIGASAVTLTVDSELTTADLDPGAGTDTRSVFGLALATTGGATLVGAGADGVPVPVSDDGGSLTVDGTFWQATQPVSGTFWQATQPISAAALPLPAGAAEQATLSTRLSEATGLAISGQLPAALVAGRLSVDVGATVLAAGAATDATLLAMSAKLPAVLGQTTMAGSLSVAIASNQSAVPVTGTFWQATQPVSGTFWQATQPVSGTFWQATQPVSGTVTAGTPTCSAADTDTVSVDQTEDAVGDLANRNYIRVTNFEDSANAVACGPTGVTWAVGATGGERLSAGRSAVYHTGTLGWFCITDAGGSATVSVFECDE